MHLELFGLSAIWYNVESAFPPTVTWISRAQSRAKRPRYIRELFSLLFLCLYLIMILVLVFVVYVVCVYYAAQDEDAAKDLFRADC